VPEAVVQAAVWQQPAREWAVARAEELAAVLAEPQEQDVPAAGVPPASPEAEPVASVELA